MSGNWYKDIRINAERFNSISGQLHSKAYHRYFEGYAEFEVLDERGRKHLKRIYAAPWYISNLDDRKRRRYKICMLFFYVLAVSVFVFTGIGGSIYNYWWVINLIQAIAFAMLVMMGLSLYQFLTANQMTVYQYNTGPKALRRRSRETAIVLLVEGASISFVSLSTLGQEVRTVPVWECMIEIITAFLPAVLIILIVMMEKKIKYIRVRNDCGTLPRDAIII